MNFIDEDKINNILKNTPKPTKTALARILTKAGKLKGLDIGEIASLIKVSDRQDLARIYKAAAFVKEKIYGSRVVLFAPLYLTNECINNCLYCGFRLDNKKLERRSLKISEAVQQARILEAQGHKRILLVCGETKKQASAKKIAQYVKAIYEQTGIRIIHINAAPFSEDGFTILEKAGIGVYQVFQETYHSETYKKMHPVGRKSKYLWRLTAMDRAVSAGIGDVGIGVLFGLYDWRFELLAIIEHIRHLEEKFGFGAHTISIPRLRPAVGAVLKKTPYPVSDQALKHIISILRLAVPYTGLVLSTREKAGLRDQALAVGVSQISAGSRTSPGGYKRHEQEINKSQFSINDTRTLDQVIGRIIKLGYIPSLCASCYRAGRTGKKFRKIADKALTKDFCWPNALLTLQEYLLDQAKPETRTRGEELIARELKKIKDKRKKQLILKKIGFIKKDERDLYF